MIGGVAVSSELLIVLDLEEETVGRAGFAGGCSSQISSIRLLSFAKKPMKLHR